MLQMSNQDGASGLETAEAVARAVGAKDEPSPATIHRLRRACGHAAGPLLVLVLSVGCWAILGTTFWILSHVIERV